MFTKAKRKLLANSLTKAAEYIFAILVLGQLITGKSNLPSTIFSVIAYVFLVLLAMVVIPEEGDEK